MRIVILTVALAAAAYLLLHARPAIAAVLVHAQGGAR